MQNDIFYHYTSIFCLNEIINSKCIWASDCRYTNDRHELNYAINLFLNELQHAKKNALRDCFFHHNISNRICIFSLSKSPHVLSQWRAYGDDGRGAAIGFSMTFLKAFRDVAHSRLIECIYNNHSEFVKTVIADKNKEIE